MKLCVWKSVFFLPENCVLSQSTFYTPCEAIGKIFLESKRKIVVALLVIRLCDCKGVWSK